MVTGCLRNEDADSDFIKVTQIESDIKIIIVTTLVPQPFFWEWSVNQFFRYDLNRCVSNAMLSHPTLVLWSISMTRFIFSLIAVFVLALFGSVSVEGQCYNSRYHAIHQHRVQHGHYGYRSPGVHRVYRSPYYRSYRAPVRYYRPVYGYRGGYSNRGYGYRPANCNGYRRASGITIRIGF